MKGTNFRNVKLEGLRVHTGVTVLLSLRVNPSTVPKSVHPPAICLIMLIKTFKHEYAQVMTKWKGYH
jgi:hypothetical protein